MMVNFIFSHNRTFIYPLFSFSSHLISSIFITSIQWMEVVENFTTLRKTPKTPALLPTLGLSTSPPSCLQPSLSSARPESEVKNVSIPKSGVVSRKRVKYTKEERERRRDDDEKRRRVEEENSFYLKINSDNLQEMKDNLEAIRQRMKEMKEKKKQKEKMNKKKA